MTWGEKARVRGALLGLGAAALPLSLAWGFTVDDALITARMAHHIAVGVGYRFNAGGEVVDAVTPLGFAYALAPFASDGALHAFTAARVMGAVAWLGAAAWLGAQMAARGTRAVRFAPLLVLATSLPLAAWASAGMETGLVLALATVATTRSRWGALLGGLAAAWRPELLPFAMTLATGAALARAAAARRNVGAAALGALALALAPAVFVGAVRVAIFGTAMPLAVLAKPSTFDTGLSYGWAALWLTGGAVLIVAPWAWLKLDGHDRTLTIAGLLHFAAIALAGGDWMPLFRLAVPALPSLLLAASAIAERARLVPTLVRVALALAAAALLWAQHGKSARGVWSARRTLIADAEPLLARARVVASVDVGWVGVAARGATIVDAAGVTDPRVARLPGGHTSKALPDAFLAQRNTDALVVLEKNGVVFRAADQRLRGQAQGWKETATLRLGVTELSYRILCLRNDCAAP